jgi:hypothetical protein
MFNGLIGKIIYKCTTSHNYVKLRVQPTQLQPKATHRYQTCPGAKNSEAVLKSMTCRVFAEFSVRFFCHKNTKKIGSSLGQRTQKLPRCFSGHWIKTWPSLVSIGQPHVIYLGNRSLHPIAPTFTEQCVRLPLSLRSTSVRDLSAKHGEFTWFNHISGHIQSAKILVSSGFPQDHSSKWENSGELKGDRWGSNVFGLDVTVANEATVHVVHCPAGSIEFREDLRLKLVVFTKNPQ